MKITIEYGGNKKVVEDQDVVDITDAFDLIEKALIEIGYDSQRVKAAFLFKAEQIQQEDDNF